MKDTLINYGLSISLTTAPSFDAAFFSSDTFSAWAGMNGVRFGDNQDDTPRIIAGYEYYGEIYGRH